MNEILKICGQEVVTHLPVPFNPSSHLMLELLLQLSLLSLLGWKEPKRFAITYFGHCSREVETDYCT
jgi:hypothetical protein